MECRNDVARQKVSDEMGAPAGDTFSAQQGPSAGGVGVGQQQLAEMLATNEKRQDGKIDQECDDLFGGFFHLCFLENRRYLEKEHPAVFFFKCINSTYSSILPVHR